MGMNRNMKNKITENFIYIYAPNSFHIGNDTPLSNAISFLITYKLTLLYFLITKVDVL